jgi:hypothetical protein
MPRAKAESIASKALAEAAAKHRDAKQSFDIVVAHVRFTIELGKAKVTMADVKKWRDTIIEELVNPTLDDRRYGDFTPPLN